MLKRIAGMAATTGVAGATVWYGVHDPAGLVQHLSDVANNQIAQAGFFFTAAAFIHAGRVKTEIKTAVSSITQSWSKDIADLSESIKSLGAALSQQLSDHSAKLDSHEKKLVELGTQVAELKTQVPNK